MQTITRETAERTITYDDERANYQRMSIYFHIILKNGVDFKVSRYHQVRDGIILYTFNRQTMETIAIDGNEIEDIKYVLDVCGETQILG